jgi:hypothetical protein
MAVVIPVNVQRNEMVSRIVLESSSFGDPSPVLNMSITLPIHELVAALVAFQKSVESDTSESGRLDVPTNAPVSASRPELSLGSQLAATESSAKELASQLALKEAFADELLARLLQLKNQFAEKDKQAAELSRMLQLSVTEAHRVEKELLDQLRTFRSGLALRPDPSWRPSISRSDRHPAAELS